MLTLPESALGEDHPPLAKRCDTTRSDGSECPFSDLAKTKVFPSALRVGWLSQPAELGAPKLLPTDQRMASLSQRDSKRSQDPLPRRGPYPSLGVSHAVNTITCPLPLSAGAPSFKGVLTPASGTGAVHVPSGCLNDSKKSSPPATPGSMTSLESVMSVRVSTMCVPLKSSAP